jgi:hypothetical protein
MSLTPTSRCRDDELFTNASKLKTNIQNQQRRRFMSLQQKLDARKKETETSAPKEALEIMHRATEDLAKSGIMDRIVRKGGKAPDFMLNDENGNAVNLKERLSRGPVVLGFYRGRW